MPDDPDAKVARRKAMLAAFTRSLPPEECSYTVHPQRIPMPDGDGVHLAADLYLPDLLPKPHGLLLAMGCYGRGPPMDLMNATIFAARGYAVLFVSSRGTFGSGGGPFVPGVSERDDAQAVVAWMRRQEWFPGCFATFGASYLGYAQWALLRAPPADLVCSAIPAAPHDHALHTWTEGAYRLDRLAWSDYIAHQEDSAPRPDAEAQVDALTAAVPLAPAAEKHFGEQATWVADFMATPDLSDPLWAPVRHAEALERVPVGLPVLLTSGWYDPFNYQTMAQYARLRERGCDSVRLVVGPWAHIAASGLRCMPEVFDFLGRHLKHRDGGGEAGRTQNPVRVFVTGAEEWRDLPDWPPTDTQAVTFFLDGEDKSLTKYLPGPDSPELTFTFDPANPTPTIGGNMLGGTGRVEDTAYASRADVLVYTSAPLTAAVEVLGRAAVQLAHATSSPYADLWVRLSEVDADGASRNVAEYYKALDPSRRADELVSVALQDCAHRFTSGTRIRLIVAGGSFPLMARNPGVAGNRTFATDLKSVEHCVRHGGGVSRVVLPCSR